MNSLWQGRGSHLDVRGCDLELDVGVLSVGDGCRGDGTMIRGYSEHDLDAVMRIWLDANIHAHSFISPDYWRGNCEMVRALLPSAEVYVHEGHAHHVDGFIGLDADYVEGLFVEEAARSKGVGRRLLDRAKIDRSLLRLSVYQKNEKAIRFYLREEFKIRSENVDRGTGEKEFMMEWNR